MMISPLNNHLLRPTPVRFWPLQGISSSLPFRRVSLSENGVSLQGIEWMSIICSQKNLTTGTTRGKPGLSAGKIAETELPIVFEGKEEKIQNLQKSAAEETLEMLEWPRLCAAVSEFAGTATAKERCKALTLPSTRDESVALLDETAAALELESLLTGVLDFGAIGTPIVKTGLDRASKGAVCTGIELAAIAVLLQFGQTLRRGIATILQENRDKMDTLLPIARLMLRVLFDGKVLLPALAKAYQLSLNLSVSNLQKHIN